MGQVGVWHPLLGDGPGMAGPRAAGRIEELGYGSLWVAETPGGKDPFVCAALLLGATRRIAVGTGIASIWSRDAAAMAGSRFAVGEAFPGRFVAGLGVSHAPLVNARGHTYAKPLTAMRRYLEAMDETAKRRREVDAPRLLAALRPGMMKLAAERADGAHPYFVPPEHTAEARAILGAGKLLVPEQAVLVETDPARARAAARAYMAPYLTLPNYVDNLRRLGHTDDDFAGGGSDRLVDAIVGWGSPDAVAARVRAHLDAGADHVAIQPLSPDGPDLDDALRQLERLAPALGL
ncbi:TIGR03620 family F420-dependent LLM class oxidoreductase [Nonomuraea sp. MCN248]|uniref:TIGR03620 family F420-dependent LLM class oxidoreductase n=1 Tax=Nonomuraea corallina TaxID=2989783 RepID=A0ABT4SBN4_9ACTN|nr:TIGR03620 family F420-dependent LLM class oxidoreductase [Nonomuraea corallina]MDA0634594.1 TIGR03620 family F420-dependent LLM class oxidoreductase [Nonomuraea corallina]